MSLFFCDRCANLRDSDEGCEEFGPRLKMLICADCAEEVAYQREQDADHAALPDSVAGGTNE